MTTTTATARFAVFALVAAGDSVGHAADAAPVSSAVGVMRFAPVGNRAALRGRATAERFGLGRRFELTLEVGNAFSEETRAAVAHAEASIGALPGVSRVIGPSRLLALGADAVGHVSAAPLGAVVRTRSGDAPEAAAGRAALFQQQVARRADALGWFLPPDGSSVRLLIDADDPRRVEASIGSAVASAGLLTLSEIAPPRPLWPQPDRDRMAFDRARPIEIALLTAFPLLFVVLGARPRGRRFAVGVVACVVAVAAPGLAAPVAAIRLYAIVAGGAAGALAIAAWLVAGARAAWLRGRRNDVACARGLSTSPAVATTTMIAPSIALVVAALVVAPGLEFQSDLSSETSLFFIDVRADVAEPVVLREIRRLTELVAAEPGVADAWSVADLFAAVPRAGSGVGGIPDDRATTRSFLQRAAADAAVALEVTTDLGEALIAVRIEETGGFDAAAVLDRAGELTSRELRPWLWRVDVADPRLSPTIRAFGRGVLAEDARRRVLRICARAGHSLSDEQRLAIDRGLRRVSLSPRIEATGFRADIAREIGVFLEEVALSEHRVASPHPAERQRLSDSLLALPGEPSASEVSRGLGELWGHRVPAATRDARAEELRRRLASLRRRAVTSLAAKTILADAELPTEGGLSEQVRDVTLEAMGPVVGLPAPAAAVNAFHLDAAIVGGIATDRALSAAWAPRMRFGILVSVMFTALLLVVFGGPRALAWWPTTLAPAAVVLLLPAIAGIPMGIMFVSVLAGALGGGALFGVALSADYGWRRR